MAILKKDNSYAVCPFTNFAANCSTACPMARSISVGDDKRRWYCGLAGPFTSKQDLMKRSDDE